MKNLFVSASIFNIALFLTISVTAQCPVIDFKSEHHEGIYPKFDVSIQKTIKHSKFHTLGKKLKAKRIDKAHSNIWIPSDSIQYIYDSNNNLTMYLKMIYDDELWINNWKIEFVYDTNNNLIKDEIQSFKNGKWVNHNRDIFTYDVHGNKINWLNQVWRSDKWVNTKRILKDFDINNNMITYHEQTWKAKKWNSTKRNLLVYDANNNKISRVGQNWTEFGWKNLDKVNFAYDEVERISSSKSQIWSQNEWINIQLEGTIFSSKGQKQIDFIKIWETTEWIEKEQTLYNYDNTKFEIATQSQKLVQGEWVVFSKVQSKVDKILDEEKVAVSSYMNNELINVKHKRTQYYYENTDVNGDVISAANESNVCPRQR